MNEINVELPDNFVKSKEMTEFFSELEAIQTIAVLRIKLGKNEADMRRRTINVTKHLKMIGRELNHHCPAGQIWDDDSHECVPI